MQRRKMFRIHLHEKHLVAIAQKNSPRFLTLAKVLCDAGYKVSFHPNTFLHRLWSSLLPVNIIADLSYDTQLPGMLFQRAYISRFWRLENTNQRDDWVITNLEFEPDSVNNKLAERFFRVRAPKISTEVAPEKPYIFIPLQATLLEKRSFQTASPIDMVRITTEQDQSRQVVISVHPTGHYSKAEMSAVEELIQHPRISQSTGSMDTLLAGCDYVVTENSSVALHGVLHRKPAILFATSEFHHIFQYVPKIGIEEAFRRVLIDEPKYVEYFYWFFKMNMIPSEAGNLEEILKKRLQLLGIVD